MLRMAWSTLVLSSLAGLLIIYYFFIRKFNKFDKLGIVNLKPWPIFGNMVSPLLKQRFMADVIDEAYKLNEETKYFGFYDFSEPVLVIKCPELIKNIGIKHFDHFVDHRGFVENIERDPLFGKSLFSLNGDKWKETRNLLSPAFTGSKMKAMFKLMSECAENFAGYLYERGLKEPFELNAKDAFMRYANDVIASCAFGISIDSMRNRKNDFYVLGSEVMDVDGSFTTKLFLLRSFPRIAHFFNIKLTDSRVEHFFVSVVKETMEMREREGVTRPDMIQLMMETCKEHRSATGIELSEMEMAAQAFIFFLAGFDTSATLMSFVAQQLAAYPLVQEKLCNEIDEISATMTDNEVTYEAINKMEYLDAIINETLRLYPIAFILDRMCVKTYKLPPALPGKESITIQPGESVWFPTYSMNRDPKYFNDPETWDPERFLGGGKNRVDQSTYLPFGLGPRMCIGNRFALLETKVMLFHLLSKCNLQPNPKTSIPLKIRKGFVMTAKGGFWLKIVPRKTTSSI